MNRRYRETSRKAWQEIKDCKLMIGSHFDLLTVVVENPDITNGEATGIYNRKFGKGLGRNEIAKRMSNLHYNYKVVKETGERICKVQNKSCISYSSNQCLPAPLPKTKKTKKQRIEELEGTIAKISKVLTRLDDAYGDKKVTVRRITKRIRKTMD